MSESPSQSRRDPFARLLASVYIFLVNGLIICSLTKALLINSCHLSERAVYSIIQKETRPAGEKKNLLIMAVIPYIFQEIQRKITSNSAKVVI